jgi:hypothetical protein
MELLELSFEALRFCEGGVQGGQAQCAVLGSSSLQVFLEGFVSLFDMSLCRLQVLPQKLIWQAQ